jgi:hypothetical protein
MALEHKFLVWDVAQNYGEPVYRISALPSWYLDIQQQYAQTINNTLHRFTSTPTCRIPSQKLMTT